MAETERVVLVTGPTGNSGPAVVRALAADGVLLGLVGRDEGRLEAVARETGLVEARWLAVAADVRRPEEARRAVAGVSDRFGRLDAVVHLVGGYTGGTPVAELDHDELRAMLEQHLWTTLHVVQAALPGMLERGWGRIVAVSSPMALEPGRKSAAYAVGKAAEETLLRTLAREVAGTGVTANILVVRAVDVAHERETEPTARNAGWTTPEELAAAVRFLCSDAAAAINGARLPLDGRA